MSSIVSIPDAVTDKVTHYRVQTKIPLRTVTAVRRYSQFVELVEGLSRYLGIDPGDFPYPLPPKSSFFSKNSERTVRERKHGLAAFLQRVVADPELQNTALVHEFLQLPAKFEFTPALVRSAARGGSEADLVIARPEDVDSGRWLELMRLFRAAVNDLMEKFAADADARMHVHSKLQVVRPNLARMEQALASFSLDEPEMARRRLALKEVQQQADALADTVLAPKRPDKTARRVFGAVETKETMPLNNRELLQHQLQIHQQQDAELLELRKIVQRQKEIGLTINQEVEEQNEMLDSLNDQVDDTTGKLRSARKKARDIL